MDLGLTDKVVLITGGSKGIGLACAHGFAAEGSKVAIASRDEANLNTAQQELKEEGVEVVTVAVDLRQPEDAVRMVDETEQQLGPVDVLVNSAGAAKRSQPDEMTVDNWHDGMNSKYFTYIHAIEASVHRMAERESGSIVNIIGSGGKVVSPTHLAGGSANAALMLATAGLARGYADRGLRVNGVSPGLTVTGRLEQSINATAAREGITPDEALQRMKDRAPLGRIARPDEVADVVVFVASERASYVSGAIVMVNGASTATVV